MIRVFYQKSAWKIDTPIEAFETKIIKSEFDGVDTMVYSFDYASKKGNPFVLIDDCDYLVFSTTSGVISRETLEEICYAVNHGIPVYEIWNTTLVEHSMQPEIDIIYEGDPNVYATVSMGESGACGILTTGYLTDCDAECSETNDCSCDSTTDTITVTI